MAISPGKLQHLKALSNKEGIIAAAAMDQRGSLQKSLASAKGVDQKAITYEMMSEFKTAVTRILTPHASAILLDPEFGLEAAKARSKNAGLLLAYEESGYDNTKPGRLPDLLPLRFRKAHRRLGRRRGQDSDLLQPLRRAAASTTSSTPSSNASVPSAKTTKSPSSWNSLATTPKAAMKKVSTSPRSSRKW